MAQVPEILDLKEIDVQRLLACQSHLGSTTVEKEMVRYVHKRRNDGVYIFNLRKTWEKLVLAARVIAAVENPQDVCAISAGSYGQRAVLKFANYSGATAVAGRFTPGTFTNQIQKKFIEPRVLIVTDPALDHQPVREASYVNVPTIAFCHTDSPLHNIDIAIPCNNKSQNSIGLLWWLLTREVLRLRGIQSRSTEWDVMIDMFIYRNPEDQEKKADDSQGQQGFEGEDDAEWANSGKDDWGNSEWADSGDKGDWNEPSATANWGDLSAD